MRKDILGCLIPLCFIYTCNVSAQTLALINATIMIDGAISMPTCKVNGKDSINIGLSQTVYMSLTTPSDIISGNTTTKDVPINIDCTGSSSLQGIKLGVSPTSYGFVGMNQPGVIKTSLDGVGIDLKWKDGSNVDLNPNSFKEFRNTNNNIYKTSIKAKIVPENGYSSSTIKKGAFKSAVNIELIYF